MLDDAHDHVLAISNIWDVTTAGSGYYPPVEEDMFWILCAYIEVYTWTTIKTNWFN
jgi:hypothetical protein